MVYVTLAAAQRCKYETDMVWLTCQSLEAQSTIATLQRVQNAAARMVLNLRPRESKSAGLRQLHWLDSN